MEYFEKIRAAVQGYKALVCVVLAVLVEILEKNSVISQASADQYLVLIMGAGGVAMITKLNRWATSTKRPE